MTPRIGIADWIGKAAANPVEHHRRQAVEVLVQAISNTAEMRDILYLKGGALMNIVYGSPRATADVDFTTSAPRSDLEGRIAALFDREMRLSAIDLGYTGLIFRVQGTEMRPPDEEFPWPTLRVKIGFASKGTPQEERLATGQAANVLRIDISFNEAVYDWQRIEIQTGEPDPYGAGDAQTATILAYSIYELIAEKLRAIVQQKIRNRYRRQDIFDIARLVSSHAFTEAEVARIYGIFLPKCRSRGIEPTRDMIDDPELHARSRERYGELRLDAGGAPLEFEADFQAVADLYRSMPWPA